MAILSSKLDAAMIKFCGVFSITESGPTRWAQQAVQIGNTYYFVKAGKKWTGKTRVAQDDHASGSVFRAYDSYSEATFDFLKVTTYSRYKGVAYNGTTSASDNYRVLAKFGFGTTMLKDYHLRLWYNNFTYKVSMVQTISNILKKLAAGASEPSSIKPKGLTYGVKTNHRQKKGPYYALSNILKEFSDITASNMGPASKATRATLFTWSLEHPHWIDEIAKRIDEVARVKLSDKLGQYSLITGPSTPSLELEAEFLSRMSNMILCLLYYGKQKASSRPKIDLAKLKDDLFTNKVYGQVTPTSGFKLYTTRKRTIKENGRSRDVNVIDSVNSGVNMAFAHCIATGVITRRLLGEADLETTILPLMANVPYDTYGPDQIRIIKAFEMLFGSKAKPRRGPLLGAAGPLDFNFVELGPDTGSMWLLLRRNAVKSPLPVKNPKSHTWFKDNQPKDR